jgi:hypothetical protein
MVLWGIERFFDEHLWLGEDGHLGSLLVQIAGVALAIVGLILIASRVGPYRQWRDTRPDPVPEPTDEVDVGDGAGHADGSDSEDGTGADRVVGELASPTPGPSADGD